MFSVQRTKLFYAVAGSGVVLGLFSYFQSEKKTARTAWTDNFQPSVKWDYNWDKRDYHNLTDAEKLENNIKRPKARRHLFLIRHGQYEISARTDKGRRLTELGRKQADLVGQRLKTLNFDYNKIIRSTMTRALETSDIIHKYFPQLPKESSDLLREGAPIPPDPPINSWKVSDKEYLKDGSRIEAAFQKHFHRADADQKEDSFEIVVCHANVIRYFVCRLLQFPPEAWLRFHLHHCSITWVIIAPSGRVAVRSIGDSGFLPEELMTS